jgi:hypothetical protein
VRAWTAFMWLRMGNSGVLWVSSGRTLLLLLLIIIDVCCWTTGSSTGARLVCVSKVPKYWTVSR